MKHKHYDMIVAWAEGKQIQVYRRDDNWINDLSPSWHFSEQYRIKPEPKPDVVVYSRVVGKFLIRFDDIEIQQLILQPADNPNIKYTFGGEWGNLKSAEVL
jgi:hypothetical protein